ncbi:cadherin-like protein 26 [Sphaeramia orbicularis]|uniref:cadherin-like protein 26 n=1 Tax=Sphaeramia orbicularis TaxID=375764 RepID=UPI00117E0AAD|nr:cadherin-like protein 26 [Sphaeramia orbicularis]
MLCFLILFYSLSSVTCAGLLSRHRRAWIIDSFNIEEGHPGPFPYELGQIDIERKYRVNFDLYGEGVDEEPKGVLSINQETGAIYVHKALDYEETTLLKLKFETRKTDFSLDTKLGIEISILDINDNPPRFQRDLYKINTDEENTQGSSLMTVLAYDRDKRGTPNSTFHYEIKSVSPQTENTEFFVNEYGVISFKGCFDHEVAEKFTVVVEAKDHGEVVSLSSSTTVIIHVRDGNNHLPTITGQMGSGKVMENEIGTSPLRLHVTDKDSPHSPAWKARYTIHGNEGKHFKIETDPETNDGILTVIRPLDFEDGAQRELSISVENEAPFFSCTVKEKTTTGLWKVDHIKGGGTNAGQPHSVKVTINVEDANDPPAFTVTVKEAMLEENAPTGTWVGKVTAIDPDVNHARDFVYEVGDDPEGWINVDPHTGDITTVGIPDRESPHVVSGVYTVLMHAVDDGQPPRTGTATLNIHVTDKNDNVPQLEVDFVDICVSDVPTTANISAFDLDDNPYGGPFTFQLLGDVEGKWKLNPSFGYTAGLVKDPGVYVGPHEVKMKISDMQGESEIYNLTVIVCDCSVTPNCRGRRDSAAKAAFSAVGIVLASLLLLLLVLLMAVFISCKKEFTSLQSGDSAGETLLVSHIETPGTDCQVPNSVLAVSTNTEQEPSNWQSLHDGMQHQTAQLTNMEHNFYKHFGEYTSEHLSHQSHGNWNQMTMNTGADNRSYQHQVQFGFYPLLFADEHYESNSLVCAQVKEMDIYSRNYRMVWNEATLALLQQKVTALQEMEKDLVEYEPHLYAEEGDNESLSDLDAISIPDNDSFQQILNNLGPEFNELAAICNRTHTQN